MEERHVDLKKAYELIVGNKVFKDKKINWEILPDKSKKKRARTAVLNSLIKTT